MSSKSEWQGALGAKWAENSLTMDLMLAPFGAAALKALGDVRGAAVLDLGCGTGVLAIAAAKLWPSADILASDIDPDAIEETDANAEKNGTTGIDAFVADGFGHEKLASGKFDILFANILAGPLQELAQSLSDRLAPGGRAILSGLLVEQIPAVQNAYHQAGLTVTDTDIIEGWAILTLEHAETSKID